jgi:hypothetical protein
LSFFLDLFSQYPITSQKQRQCSNLANKLNPNKTRI